MTATEMTSAQGVAASGRAVLGSWHGDVQQLYRGPQGMADALQRHSLGLSGRGPGDTSRKR